MDAGILEGQDLFVAFLGFCGGLGIEDGVDLLLE